MLLSYALTEEFLFQIKVLKGKENAFQISWQAGPYETLKFSIN